MREGRREEENVPGGVGFLLIEVNTRHACPGEGIHVKQLGKEPGNVPELVRLQTMDCGILNGGQ